MGGSFFRAYCDKNTDEVNNLMSLCYVRFVWELFRKLDVNFDFYFKSSNFNQKPFYTRFTTSTERPQSFSKNTCYEQNVSP